MITESPAQRIARASLLPRILARAAHPRKLTKPLDPEAAQHSQHVVIEPERGDWKIAELAERIIIRGEDRTRPGVMRKRPSRTRCRRERSALSVRARRRIA